MSKLKFIKTLASGNEGHRRLSSEGQRIRTRQPDLICCTGNYTKIEIPPMVLPLIVGGQRAQQGQFPSMAAIMNNGRQFCGGSILDSTHVLTAAHCIAHMGGTELSRVTLQIGDHAIYSTSDGPHQTKKVSRLSKHKQFSSTTLHNDIAILTLSSPVTYNSNVRAISPSSSSGSTATVAGWGRLYDGGMFPSVLYYVNVNIVPNSSCKQTYGSRAPGGIISSMVCAGSRAGDACSGDSGGPLMVGGSQIGIVSWGIGCGGYPGVYTRVSSFLPWIQKNQRH
ncbi:unnamed protein product [Allacma fusca]|uniref:Peptidase S1 domain-containing protein n=1 Tax=Allacma fusca TaxID=39272 RepID=A0A8J2PAX3_9HEXA|nr:unnamed protein product [Allacma fusca]